MITEQQIQEFVKKLQISMQLQTINSHVPMDTKS